MGKAVENKKSLMAPSTDLMDPQQALTVYLDALLCEVAFPDAVPSANTEKQPQEVLTVEPDIPETALPETVADPVAVSTVTEAEPEASRQDDRAWAEEPFQCMTFQVGGLTLAAPLEKLNGIVQWDDSITELPGYAPWFLGLLTTRGENVQVVDLAQIVIPPDRRAGLADARERVKFVVLMEQGSWGIAVDSLSQVVTLSPDEVRWSGEGRKRQWLAGMVKEHMSALLDLDRLHEELAAGLKLD